MRESREEGRPPTSTGFHLSHDWRDWVFVGCVTQWFVVNIILYFPYAVFLYNVGTFQTAANSIFPITWVSALGLFIWGLWLFLRKYLVDPVRSVIYALGLPLAATSFFEIIWQNIGAGLHIGNQSLMGNLINLSSMVMALSSFRYWRATFYLFCCVSVFIGGWIFWFALGYPQIHAGKPEVADIAFLFNALLKVLAFVLFAVLVSFASDPRSRKLPLVSGANLVTPPAGRKPIPGSREGGLGSRLQEGDTLFRAK